MEFGDVLTRWTARVAVVLFVASLALRRFRPSASRYAWTVGCFIYLLHVAAAFHYYHHWSHSEAYEFIARQTRELVGLDWGGGVYVNHAFTLVWLADVAWWWARDGRKVPSLGVMQRGIHWLAYGFLGFVAFHATVVFATGFSRWLGMGACVLLVAVWFLPMKEQRDVGQANHRRAGLDGGDNR